MRLSINFTLWLSEVNIEDEFPQKRNALGPPRAVSCDLVALVINTSEETQDRYSVFQLLTQYISDYQETTTVDSKIGSSLLGN
jgi:hypothetical protein